jgi:hypothetical protein
MKRSHRPSNSSPQSIRGCNRVSTAEDEVSGEPHGGVRGQGPGDSGCSGSVEGYGGGGGGGGE